MELEQLEERVDELSAKQDAGEDVADELAKSREELLNAYASERKKRSGPEPSEDDDVDEQHRNQCRALLLQAGVRLGADGPSVLAFFSKKPHELIEKDGTSFKWHTGQTVLDGLRDALPAELQNLRAEPHDNSPAAEKRREIQALERELENAEKNAHRNGLDNATLALANRARRRLKQAQSELADMQPTKSAPAKREPSPSEIAKLRSLELTCEKFRKAAAKSPRDNSKLAAYSKARRELTNFRQTIYS